MEAIKVIDHDTGEIVIDDPAGEINQEHELFIYSQRSAIEHAVRCGQLLCEQKARLKHGEWIPWVKEHCGFSEDMAQRYMRLALNTARVRYLDSASSIRAALLLLAEPKPKEEEPKLRTIAEGYGRLTVKMIKDSIWEHDAEFLLAPDFPEYCEGLGVRYEPYQDWAKAKFKPMEQILCELLDKQYKPPSQDEEETTYGLVDAPG